MGFTQPITTFRQGLRTDLDANAMPIGAAAAILNMLFDRESLRVRPGLQRQWQVSNGSYGVRAFAEFYYSSAVSTIYKILAVSDYQVLVTGSDGTFTSPVVLDYSEGSAMSLRFAQYQENMFFVDRSVSSGPVYRCLYDAADYTKVQEIGSTDEAVYFVSSPTQGSGGTLPEGNYTVGISYARLALDGTTTVEGPLTQSANIPIVATGKSITFSVLEPSDSLATDIIYVYLQYEPIIGWAPYTIPTYYRVQLNTCTGTPGAAHAITILTAATGLEYTYVAYAMRPPTGITNIRSWNGRMYYTKGDTLYISNYNSPDVVPQTFTVNALPNAGGYAQIGTDGGAITALCPFGSSLIIFKQRGIWQLVGDCGSPDFMIQPLSNERGALAQEGVCVAEGNLLLWTEAASVWAFNGSMFFEIGRPISTAWAALAATSGLQAACPMVYDPNLRQVLLIVNATPATPMSAIAYVCDVTEPIGTLEEDPTSPLYSWTQYAGLPGAAAHVLVYAPVQGVYASDTGYAGSESGIFLVNSPQTVDDGHATTSGNAIAYHWLSGMLYGGNPQLYKCLAQVSALLGLTVPLTGATLDVYLDGSAMAAATRANITNFKSNGQYLWYPAPLPACLAFQLGVSGSSSTGGELLALGAGGTGMGALR